VTWITESSIETLEWTEFTFSGILIADAGIAWVISGAHLGFKDALRLVVNDFAMARVTASSIKTFEWMEFALSVGLIAYAGVAWVISGAHFGFKDALRLAINDFTVAWTTESSIETLEWTEFTLSRVMVTDAGVARIAAWAHLRGVYAAAVVIPLELEIPAWNLWTAWAAILTGGFLGAAVEVVVEAIPSILNKVIIDHCQTTGELRRSQIAQSTRE
jgi:uncharacterized membrane protein YczE